jgi:hypothetical protein
MFSKKNPFRYNGIDASSIKGWPDTASHDGAPNREAGSARLARRAHKGGIEYGHHPG